MLTPTQQKEIIDYLISKRMTYDLASEIFDHMSEQIIDLQKEGFTFEQSWEKTKTAWLSELRMTYDARFSLDDITVLSKKMIQTRNRVVVPKLVLFSLCFTMLTFTFIALTSIEYMRMVQVLFFVLVLLIMGKSYYDSRLYTRLSKRQGKTGNWLTANQSWVTVPLAFGGFLVMFANIDHWEGLKMSIDRVLSDVSTITWRNIASLVGSTMLYTMFYFGFLLGFYSTHFGKKSLERALNFKNKIEELELEISK